MADIFLQLSAADRREALGVAATKSGRPVHLLEKDIWVVWTLDVLFGAPFANKLVFKGGTSLSKAYAVIRRFSEDIDLSVTPATVGISEAEVNEAGSRRQRDQWMDNLEAACSQWAAGRLQPDLEREISGLIGQRVGHNTIWRNPELSGLCRQHSAWRSWRGIIRRCETCSWMHRFRSS